MKPLARIILTVCFFALLFGGTFFISQATLLRGAPPLFSRTSPTHSSELTFAGGIHFEIATTTAAQARGLSGRREIPANYAMLFVFKKDGRYGFWMKEMYVPLDIVWLSDTGTIVGIDQAVQPDTYPHVFYPPQPVRYVLEMHAGAAQEHGWKVGTVVPLPLPYGKDVSRSPIHT